MTTLKSLNLSRMAFVAMFLASTGRVSDGVAGSQRPIADTTARSSNAQEHSIPVELVNSELLIPAKVNGEHVTFILDSGAHSFFVDERIANGRKLVQRGEQRNRGAGEGEALLPLVHGLRLEIAGLRWTDVTASVMDLASISDYLGSHVDGVAGQQIFSQSAIAIDYLRRQIRLISSPLAAVPTDAVVVPITDVGGNYAVHATLTFHSKQQVEGLFLLDTGAGPITVGLTREQVGRVKIDLQTAQQDAIPAMGGTFRARLVPAEKITLGGAVVRGITVHMAENTSGGMSGGPYAGIIGGGFFRNFLTIFDVPKRRLILQPPSSCVTH